MQRYYLETQTLRQNNQRTGIGSNGAATISNSATQSSALCDPNDSNCSIMNDIGNETSDLELREQLKRCLEVINKTFEQKLLFIQYISRKK